LIWIREEEEEEKKSHPQITQIDKKASRHRGIKASSGGKAGRK